MTPLQEPQFDVEQVKMLGTTVRQRIKTVEMCLYDSIIKELSFQQIDDAIACGLSTTKETFVIQVTMELLSVSLIIPLMLG
jgi:hypothetical protein